MSEKSNETATAKEINIPNFLLERSSNREQNTPRSRYRSINKHLKHIEVQDEDQHNWQILQELDDLIGRIIKYDLEPNNCNMKYKIYRKDRDNSDTIQGTIHIKD